MTESKMELTERLRREGRWSEASRFKDETVRKLRREGRKRTEAIEQAWAAMAASFPPLVPTPTAEDDEPGATVTVPTASGCPTTTADGRGESAQGNRRMAPVADDDIDIDALLERFGDGQPNLVRDTLWTYEALANRKAKPADAPSLGAWSLLQWARQYRNRFFEQVLPKAMAARTAGEEEDQMVRRERKRCDEIEAVLRRFQDAARERWKRELLDDVPGTIQETACCNVSEWAKRYRLSLTDDARSGLEAQVARLVHDCITALAPASGDTAID